MEDDDFFFDGDLDNIEDTTLEELEQTAVTSTQRAKTAVPVQPPARLVRPNLPQQYPSKSDQRNPPWRPPLQSRSVTAAVPSGPPASAPEPPSSDYGFDDEDVIDLDNQSALVNPVSRAQQSVNVPLRPSAAAAKIYRTEYPSDPETLAAYTAADVEIGAQKPDEWPQWAALRHTPTAANADLLVLQARISELEAERERLKQSEQEVRDVASAKQGEIAIVRANQDKAVKEYERRLAVMQKLHADEKAKHKAELEAARKEREKMETDNRFLQHDLAQETERAKRLIEPGKARVLAFRETPRKMKRAGVGDGFEDDEVLVPSPSKARDKSGEQTPRAGAKRKRRVNDSPVAALSFESPVPSPRQVREGHPQTSLNQQGNSSQGIAPDEQYMFIQRFLNHTPFQGHERSLEALTKHALPSNPNKSLSSILMDQMMLSASVKDHYLPLRLCRVLLQLWSRCVDESYFAALYLIRDLIQFALRFELASVKAQIIEEVVPLCIRTTDPLAMDKARASVKPVFAATRDEEAQAKLAQEIDVDETLGFLLEVCNASTLVTDRIEVFWQNMTIEYTLLMMNKAQSASQITTMLQILSSSCLATTFGVICENGEKQSNQENGIVERLTTLLFEVPQAPTNEPPYTEEEMGGFRLEILKVLKRMCLGDHGGGLLAMHRSAIGRLIRFLHVQLTKLPTLTPKLKLRTSSTSSEPDRTAHGLVTSTINTTVRIVYHLLHKYNDNIDLVEKLGAIRGGYHKFLISMTRIAFSEQLVLESGIEDEVVEAAHSILDGVLSPQEGEAVVRAIETSTGSKGETYEKSRLDAGKLDENGDAEMEDPD